MVKGCDFEKWKKEWEAGYKIEGAYVFIVSHPSFPDVKYFSTEEEAQRFVSFDSDSLIAFYENWEETSTK